MPYTKLALKREPGYPIGQPAPLYIDCLCGTRITHIEPKNYGDIRCVGCDRIFDSTGYILRGPATPDQLTTQRRD